MIKPPLRRPAMGFQPQRPVAQGLRSGGALRHPRWGEAGAPLR